MFSITVLNNNDYYQKSLVSVRVIRGTVTKNKIITIGDFNI